MGSVAPQVDTASSPFHHLHPSAPFIWRLTLVPVVIGLGLVATALSIVVGVAVASLLVSLLVAVIAVVAVMAVGAAWWYPTRRYRHWQYRIGDDALELRHGVWFRATAAVPYHRIQQIDVEQGPLQRRHGVVTLRLRTAAAGTEGAVPHIAAAEAELLRSRLLAIVGEPSQAMSHDGL